MSSTLDNLLTNLRLPAILREIFSFVLPGLLFLSTAFFSGNQYLVHAVSLSHFGSLGNIAIALSASYILSRLAYKIAEFFFYTIIAISAWIVDKKKISDFIVELFSRKRTMEFGEETDLWVTPSEVLEYAGHTPYLANEFERAATGLNFVRVLLGLSLISIYVLSPIFGLLTFFLYFVQVLETNSYNGLQDDIASILARKKRAEHK